MLLGLLASSAWANTWSNSNNYDTTPSDNGTRSQLVLPHDVYPGFEVMHFPSRANGETSNFRLLETGFSRFFTVLENGIVMTTSDLTPLVNRPVNLIVLEEQSNRSETHDLHLYVINRRNMLTFSHERLGDGEVEENAAAGTPVDEFPVLRAKGNFPVHYSIQPEEDGSRPFALAETHLKQTGFNLTLRSPKQGVRVVTARPLDRETKSVHKLVVHAYDADYISTSRIEGQVKVLDVNDNSPLFEQAVYNFEISPTNIEQLRSGSSVDPNVVVVPQWKRFATLGKVLAKDADGDKVAYKLITPTNLVIIVPQTGELLLAGEPEVAPDVDTESEFLVEAHDLGTPSRTAPSPARVVVRFLTSTPDRIDEEVARNEENEETEDVDDEEQHTVEENVIEGFDGQPHVHRIRKRRVTRAVRPTKKIEFTESEGDAENKVVFHLEKENERETYKIRDPNKWVTVGPNGTVRVKQKWDYEELGPEKTIDFWVTITNAGEIYVLYTYFDRIKITFRRG